MKRETGVHTPHTRARLSLHVHACAKFCWRPHNLVRTCGCVSHIPIILRLIHIANIRLSFSPLVTNPLSMATNTLCCRVTVDRTFMRSRVCVLISVQPCSSNSSHHNPDAPSTELQLKPHHLPFKVMKKWQEILESFAIGDTYDGKCGHLCFHTLVFDQTSEVFFV
jgi:hypothetical protein